MIATGAEVKELRKRHDLTQQELAAMLQCSIATVGNWEGGRTIPDVYHQEKLAQLTAELGSLLPAENSAG